LYFPYETIINAFSKVEIDAQFDEKTSESVFTRKISKWNALSQKERKLVEKALIQTKNKELIAFLEALDIVLTRQIKSIFIIPLYGNKYTLSTVEQAVKFLTKYKGEKPGDIYCFEIIILYNNGNRIDARFNDSKSAIDFLSKYRELSTNKA
jgi:hypothetical protein